MKKVHLPRRAVARALVVVALMAGGAPAWAAPQKTAATVLVLGDSLSAEYGIRRDSGWVELLQQRLAREGFEYSVVNASISGETSSGGRTRLPALLKQHEPAVVVIELGANDGLRGLPIATLRENLRNMVDASRKQGARVLLVGMQIPPNYGRQYTEQFEQAFAQIARDEKVALVPFLLEGFAEQMDLFQSDRIHPTEAAQKRMLDNVWPRLQPLLRTRK